MPHSPLKPPEHNPGRPEPPPPERAPTVADRELNLLRYGASVEDPEAMRELCRRHDRPPPQWAALPSTAAVQLDFSF